MKSEPLGGTKPDEALSILNLKLSNMVEDFRLKLRELIANSSLEDLNAELNICVALYFCSYFHIKNASCRSFLAKLETKDHSLLSFLKAWELSESTRLSKVKDSTRDKFAKCDFDTYLYEIQRVEEQAMTNPKRF